MKTNESNMDRVIRAVVGAVLLVLYFTNVVAGTFGIVLMIIGAILLLTGIVGFCPLYTLFKIDTKKA